MILLTLALLASQETPVVWQAVDSGNPDLTIEVSDLRPESDILHFTVRVASPKTKRALILAVDLNCAAKTSRLVGDGKVYEDGKFSQPITTPERFQDYAPVGPDPIAGPLATALCK